MPPDLAEPLAEPVAADPALQEQPSVNPEELDENGPRSGRARKLAGKLTQLQARRAKAEGSEAAILDLGLRPLPSPDGGEAADHEAEADAGSDRR